MPQDRDDPEARRRQLALFRFAIISDLDIEALPRGQRSARLADLATRTYRVPEGHERQFSVRTLWTWWSAYCRHGLDGLLPRRRRDRGTPRALVPELLEAAIALRREVPSRSTATLIDILETQHRVVRGQLRRARSIATSPRPAPRVAASRRSATSATSACSSRAPTSSGSATTTKRRCSGTPTTRATAPFTSARSSIITRSSSPAPRGTAPSRSPPWNIASSRQSSPAAAPTASTSTMAPPTAPTSSRSPAPTSGSSSATARRT